MTSKAEMPKSLKIRALKGGAWTIAGMGASHFFRLVSNLIMTRLLAPEAFGLMALANTLQIWLTMFSDLGMHGSIMRSKSGLLPDFLSTAFCLQIARNTLENVDQTTR